MMRVLDLFSGIGGMSLGLERAGMRTVAFCEIEPWEGNSPRTVQAGHPDRRPRLRALGNAVVPQVVELIGRSILDAAAEPELRMAA